MRTHYHKACIITAHAERLRRELVLGNGGWMPPEERDVLDWMTLLASMGWEIMVKEPRELLHAAHLLSEVHWLICAADLGELPNGQGHMLKEHIANYRVLVIGEAQTIASFFLQGLAAGECPAPFPVMGRNIRYAVQAHEREWACRQPFTSNAYRVGQDAHPAIYLDDAVIGYTTGYGKSSWLHLGFHPSKARDKEGLFSDLLKEVLIRESTRPVAWYEWSHTLLLRLDDPGSAQRVYDKKLGAQTLTAGEWAAVGNILQERKAQLSIGYVPAWVDDGEGAGSKLWVNNVPVVNRIKGKHYPAPAIRYACGGAVARIFDYANEFNAIRLLERQGRVRAEMHGYTHLFPDTSSWLAANDRGTRVAWYREFGASAMAYAAGLPASQHPMTKGLLLFQELFHRMPSTIIFPGEEYTASAVRMAWEKGIRQIGSYYLAMPVHQQLCWNHFIVSPYLDKADASYFDHALPVVGYFHDFDLTRHGVGWLSHWLDQWIQQGAAHFIDYAGLASVLGSTLHIQEEDNAFRVVRSNGIDRQNRTLFRLGLYDPAKGSCSVSQWTAGQSAVLFQQEEKEIYHLHHT